MAPSAVQPAVKEAENESGGIKAVLLGPPGAGKGTQVSWQLHGINVRVDGIFFLGSTSEAQVVRVSFSDGGHASR